MEKDAGLGAIHGDAIAAEVKVGESDGGFGVAGLYFCPKLIGSQV